MSKRTSTILFFFVFSLFLMFFYCTSLAFGPSNENLYQGIDISSWQGYVNFSAVKKSGIDIVYIKSSEGISYVNPYLEYSYKNAKSNGLKVGFYHYVTAKNTTQARNQATFFAKTISGKQFDCKLAMDFENFSTLSKYEVNQISKVFLNTLQSLSNSQPIIYSNSYSARTIFDKSLNSYPLWIANYGVTSPSNNGKWQYWQGWQYTSSGRVNGVSGSVDRNVFTSDIFVTNSSISTFPDSSFSSIIYTVKRGDTLSAIALKYKTTVSSIVAQNSFIVNPNLIYPGQKISISSNINFGSSSTSTKYYKIKYGDTLSQIASRFGTTVSKIARLNNISNPNLIYAGRTILIPSR